MVFDNEVNLEPPMHPDKEPPCPIKQSFFLSHEKLEPLPLPLHLLLSHRKQNPHSRELLYCGTALQLAVFETEYHARLEALLFHTGLKAPMLAYWAEAPDQSPLFVFCLRDSCAACAYIAKDILRSQLR